ncbi:GGDEF domain protein [Bacillus sp. JCM 19046]|uniref:RsbT co-antagonist protein RsbR n=1 Tax=Shouchella xiaoxiensis TaxID=766895 RepID=A0ABS2SWS8_9BACI|nr:GAF domain-containing protein [Shouchella xiaoxiensis]MBM7839690.1 rsbT co-antagonist protein RsbR [Shouchella xiaoxiensis]GAF14700.1 GGDEF domain protein [Bacillus sp. JCM 19045]GAF16400.1 GGDEF domain protein [Bacillus sp. JCM 19046]
MGKKKQFNSHESLVEVSNKLFEIIVRELNVNTAYIARQNEQSMTVVNSHNESEDIVPKDYEIDYRDSNCKYVLESEQGEAKVDDLMTFHLTKDRDVTKELQVRGFMGVTLRSIQGDLFGTLCVMDKSEKQFTDNDLAFLKTMADILSYMIELDETSSDIELLSVPIIPIRSGLAILALQGNIGKKRGRKILEDTMDYAVTNRVNHFVIDLSEVKYSENEFANLIHQLISALRLMGVKVLLSGVPVELAHDHEIRDQLVRSEVEFVNTIEAALIKVGYVLEEVN